MKTIILANARVHTFNSRAPLAESVAVRDGAILDVGLSDKLITHSGDGLEIVDLHGMTVLPGFTDSHIHLLEYGLSLRRIRCDFLSLDACLDLVYKESESAEPDQWILGHGWDQNLWEGIHPQKEDLDRAAPGHPTYLTHKSLHSAWANSDALQRAGITAETRDPPGGKIDRNKDGIPSGILYESAMRLVEKVIPLPDRQTKKTALLKAQEELLKYGITSVHDFDRWEILSLLLEMESEGELLIRVVKGIPRDHLDSAIELGMKSGDGSSLIKIGWLKLFADGALGTQTAAMLEPYENGSSKGMLFLDANDIIEIGRKALEKGICPAIHAIGDRANQDVIVGLENLKSEGLFERSGFMPRIEHVQIIQRNDMGRMATAGIAASMQPIHAISDREMAEEKWGDRCQNAYAWKSIHDAGVLLSFGSDAPVESPNPFWGLYAAISRKSIEPLNRKSGWYPEECLSLDRALASYITNPHITVGNSTGGRIIPGNPADLVIISGDIYNMDSEKLKNLSPEKVMAGGQWCMGDY